MKFIAHIVNMNINHSRFQIRLIDIFLCIQCTTSCELIMLHLKVLQPKLVNANRITISIKIGLKPRQHFYMAITKTNILWA